MMDRPVPPEQWKEFIPNAIGNNPHKEKIAPLFSDLLDVVFMNDWKGACHESSAAMHVLLTEAGIPNQWCLGEAKNGNAYFDHSWIEIEGTVYDIAICNPLHAQQRSGPIINGINIETQLLTQVLHGVVSGQPIDVLTQIVKAQKLTSYLLQSPIHPSLGTWAFVAQVAQYRFGKVPDLKAWMEKYDKVAYVNKPS